MSSRGSLSGPALVALAAVVGLAVCLCPAAVVAQGTCVTYQIYTVSPDDDQLRVLELGSQALITSHTIEYAGTPPDGVNALAIDPTSGEIYLLMRFSNPSLTWLASFDPSTGIATPIGSTILEFVTLAFTETGELYGVSADGATPPSALCTISTTTGAPADVCGYTAGDNGEAIAFDTADSMFYHASGTLDVIFEATTDISVAPCDTTPIAIAGTPLVDDAVTALAYWEGEDAFLWKQGLLQGPLYKVTSAGEVTLLGELDHAVSGMAVIALPTPCLPGFARGDANGDGIVNIVDPVFLLSYGFVPGSPAPECMDAADVNDDGAVSGLVDAIFLLFHLFVPGSPPPPPPFGSCGDDPTLDALDCGAVPACP